MNGINEFTREMAKHKYNMNSCWPGLEGTPGPGVSPYWDPTPFHGPPFFKTIYIKLNRGFGLGKIIQGQYLDLEESKHRGAKMHPTVLQD